MKETNELSLRVHQYTPTLFLLIVAQNVLKKLPLLLAKSTQFLGHNKFFNFDFKEYS